MNKGPSKTSLLILVALNLAAAGLWFIFLARTKAASAALGQGSAELAAEESKGAYLATAEEDLRASQTDRASLAGFFVEEGAEAVFLERVESMARHAGVSMKVADFSRQGDKLRLLVQSKGNFRDSYYFLRLLEALPLSLSLNSFNLENAKDEQGKPQWQGEYEILLSSYLPKQSK